MSDTNERIAYVVTSGEYSQYGICAVFDNLESATAYAGDWAGVEEFTLNRTKPVEREYWRASISPPDDTVTVDSDTTDDWVRVRSRLSVTRAWFRGDGSRGYPVGYYATAVALDADTAVKIARDMLAKIKSLHATTGATHIPLDW